MVFITKAVSCIRRPRNYGGESSLKYTVRAGRDGKFDACFDTPDTEKDAQQF